MLQRIETAQRLAEQGNLEGAWKACEESLNEDPENHHAMILASFLLEKKNSPSISYHISKRLTQMFPLEAAGWTNLGRCCDILWRMDESISAYENALQTARSDKARCTVWLNMAAVYLQLSNWNQARYCSQNSLRIEPENRKARHNLGLCQLANREWEDGWKNYKYSLGSGNRTAFSYVGESEWDGAPGKTVVVYGEQGLGDEICFASMFKDLIGTSKKVIIECDKRLATLFERSFPEASVYGTRTQKSLNWRDEDRNIDASVSSGSLGSYFRNTDDSFKSGKYLYPDQDKHIMWKGLFESKKKPVIGIAWTGGVPSTAQHVRSLKLEQLLPVLKSVDAHWVSLQYKNASEEINALHENHGVRVHQYPFGTLVSDYDDTAAMVSALDAVVSVPTSVVHLAGALGVHCISMKALTSCWKFESGLLFHPEVQLINNIGWDATINKAAKLLQEKYV